RDRYAKLDAPEGGRAVRVALDLPLIRGRIEGIDPDSPLLGGRAGRGAGGGAPYSWEDASGRVLWTVDWVARHYPVDPDRVALRGESMGGMGAIAIALAHPERFAAFHAYVPVFGTEQATADHGWAMMRFNAYATVKDHPAIDFPFILY